MKKNKYKALTSKSALQGAAVGLMTAIIIFLLSMDSPALAKVERISLADIFYFFPGLWAVLTLPFLFAVTNYWISRKLSGILNKQFRKIKKEAGRTRQVLAFIENIRQDKLDIPLKNKDKKDQQDKNKDKDKKDQEKNKENKKDEKKDEKSGSQGQEMNKEEMERFLEALQEKDKEVQEKAKQQQIKTNKKITEKEW